MPNAAEPATLDLLEPRLLLSGVQWMDGLVGPDDFPEQAFGQVVYLDFDGAHNVTYEGPVSVDGIDVPAFSGAAIGLAGEEADLIRLITADVSARLSPFGVSAVASVPAGDEFSTIYVGGTGEAFTNHGTFDGLAEAVDAGNLDRRDDGFVFTEAIGHGEMSARAYCSTLADVIVHEAGHLLGLRHAEPAASPGLLADVAHARDAGKEVHQWIVIEAFDFYDSQFVGSELGNYVGYGSPSQWLGNSTSDHGNSNIAEGTHDEDNGINWMNHFVAGGDGGELYDGLSVWDSAYERAGVTTNFWGSAIGAYGSNKSAAYYNLGRVAHLLTDMTVPAHVHLDEHPLFDTYEVELAENDSYNGHNVWFKQYTSATASGQIRSYANLEQIFRETVDYTEDYDSDDENGDYGTGGAFSSSRLADLGLTQRHKPGQVDRSDNSWGLHGGIFCTAMSGGELRILADDLMPWAIEQIASLYGLFYSQVDGTDPVVFAVSGLSDDVGSPTAVDASSLTVSCNAASDPQSGVDIDGYEFLTSRWLGSTWSSWTHWGDSQRTRQIGSLDDGLYAIYVTAENGGGRTGASPIRYFEVDTSSPQPGQPVLAAVSDTGVGGDNRTMLDNSTGAKTLQFDIGQTVAGATVRLYAGGVEIGSETADGTTTTITTTGAHDLVDGDHTIVARQTAPGYTQSDESAGRVITVDTIAPTVEDYGLSSSHVDWRLGTIDSDVWTVGRAFETAPWSSVNVLAVGFDEAVTAVVGDMTISGSDAGALAVAGVGGSGTADVEWTVAGTAGGYLDNDRYDVAIGGGVTDIAGNAMAGGWTADLAVLPGDINGDGEVGSLDRRDLRNAYGSEIGHGGYVALVDVNGDGSAGSLDRRVLRNHYAESLPPVVPATEAPATPGGAVLVTDSDVTTRTFTTADGEVVATAWSAARGGIRMGAQGVSVAGADRTERRAKPQAVWGLPGDYETLAFLGSLDATDWVAVRRVGVVENRVARLGFDRPRLGGSVRGVVDRLGDQRTAEAVRLRDPRAVDGVGFGRTAVVSGPADQAAVGGIAIRVAPCLGQCQPRGNEVDPPPPFEQAWIHEALHDGDVQLLDPISLPDR